jgi:hypothetical protein
LSFTFSITNQNVYIIELIYKISLELHTQTYLSPTNNTTSKPSTEKANSFRNKAQEKQTHYFKRSLTPNPHIPHEQNSCASACNTSTTQNQPHQISNTQRTEVCTISNSHKKVHKHCTNYQTTNEKYHTQTNRMITKHNR